MEAITVQVVYDKGVLKPKTKLPFPDKSVLEVRVKPATGKKQSAFGSLIGIWSDLSDTEVRDLEKSLAKARRVSGLKVKKSRGKLSGFFRRSPLAKVDLDLTRDKYL